MIDPLRSSRARRQAGTSLRGLHALPTLTESGRKKLGEQTDESTFQTTAQEALEEATGRSVRPQPEDGIIIKAKRLPGAALRAQCTEIASPSSWNDAIPAIYLMKGPCDGDFIRYVMFQEDVWDAAIAHLRDLLNGMPASRIRSEDVVGWPLPESEVQTRREWYGWLRSASHYLAVALDATNIRPEWLGPVGHWANVVSGAPYDAAMLTSTGNAASSTPQQQANYADAWSRVLPLLYDLKLPRRLFFLPYAAFAVTHDPFVSYCGSLRASSPGLNPSYVNPQTRFEILNMTEADFIASAGQLPWREFHDGRKARIEWVDDADFAQAPGTYVQAPAAAMSGLGGKIWDKIRDSFTPEGATWEYIDHAGLFLRISEIIGASRALVDIDFADVVVAGVVNWWLQTEVMFEVGFADSTGREQIREATKKLAQQVREGSANAGASAGAALGTVNAIYGAIASVVGVIVGALVGWIVKLVGAARGCGPGFPDAPFIRTMGDVGQQTDCMVLAGRIDEDAYREIRTVLLPKISEATGVPLPLLTSLTDDVPNDPGATLQLDAPVVDWTPEPNRTWLWILGAATVGTAAVYAITKD